MGLIKFRSIQIWSNGSINFCFDRCTKKNCICILEKDHKNFFSNTKKKSKYILKSDNSFGYKNKYLNK